MTDDVSYHFMFLFTIRIFSSVKRLFIIFARILNQVFFFWELFIYFGYTSFIKYMLCKYFLPVWGFVFSFPKQCFLKTLFNSEDGHLINLFFVNHAFGVISKKCLPNLRTQRFSSTFSSRNFIVLGWTFIFWVNICIWLKIRHFPSRYPNVSVLFVEKLFFLLWICHASLSEINCPYMHGCISEISTLYHWSICLKWC